MAPWRELSQNIMEEIGTHKTCEENTVGCTHTSPTHCLQFAPFVSEFVGSSRKQATASLWNVALGLKLLESSWLHFLSLALFAYKTLCNEKCNSTTIHLTCAFTGILCTLPDHPCRRSSILLQEMSLSTNTITVGCRLNTIPAPSVTHWLAVGIWSKSLHSSSGKTGMWTWVSHLPNECPLSPSAVD